MKKQTCLLISHNFHADRKGAKYAVNGTFKNAGEIIEMSIAQNGFGIMDHVKDSLAYDQASDIQVGAVGYSVKSPDCSLTEKLTSTENNETAKAEIIEKYFNTVHSDYFIYGVIVNDEISYYIMNADEFKQFMIYSFKLARQSGKVTYKLRNRVSATKCIAWLESRV